MRGPGETQLETDRRLISHRIKVLRDRLRDVQRGRAIQRQARRSEFRASLVGYTNAGKSSMLRALSGAQRHRRRESSLRHARSADARRRPGRERARAGHRHRRFHSQAAAPSRRVVSSDARGSARGRSAAARDRRGVAVVAGAGRGRESGAVGARGVRAARRCSSSTRSICSTTKRSSRCSRRMRDVRRAGGLRVGVGRGRPRAAASRAVVDDSRQASDDVDLGSRPATASCIAEIHRQGEVLDQRMEGDRLVIKARIDAALAGRLERAGATVSNGKAPH